MKRILKNIKKGPMNSKMVERWEGGGGGAMSWLLIQGYMLSMLYHKRANMLHGTSTATAARFHPSSSRKSWFICIKPHQLPECNSRSMLEKEVDVRYLQEHVRQPNNQRLGLKDSITGHQSIKPPSDPPDSTTNSQT